MWQKNSVVRNLVGGAAVWGGGNDHSTLSDTFGSASKIQIFGSGKFFECTATH